MIELRKAYVYICDTFAGVLSETDFGYSFVYDEEYSLKVIGIFEKIDKAFDHVNVGFSDVPGSPILRAISA